MRRQHARRQAGCTTGDSLMGVNHRHLPAAPGQAGGTCCTGQTGANHQAALGLTGPSLGDFLRSFRLPAGVEKCLQHVRISRQAGGLDELKAAVFETFQHAGCQLTEGQPAAASATTGYSFERVQLPSGRWMLRSQAIEENAVRSQGLQLEHVVGISDTQAQQHVAVFKTQPVQALEQTLPLCYQFLRQWQKLWQSRRGFE